MKTLTILLIALLVAGCGEGYSEFVDRRNRESVEPARKCRTDKDGRIFC